MISLPNPMTDSVRLHSALVELFKEDQKVLQQLLDEYISSLNTDELNRLEDFIVNYYRFST